MNEYRIDFGNGQIFELGRVPLKVAKQAMEAQREANRRLGTSDYNAFMRLKKYVGDDHPDGWATVKGA